MMDELREWVSFGFRTRAKFSHIEIEREKLLLKHFVRVPMAKALTG